jgi:hypothetical protein
MVKIKGPGESPNVRLIDGEVIQLAIGSVCRPQQVFIRLGKNLVAGILNHDGDSAVYLWMKDADEAYQYAGDISVYDNNDGTAMLQVVPGDGEVDSPLEKKSLEFHREQIRELAGCLKHSSFHGTKMKFLVGVTGKIRE